MRWRGGRRSSNVSDQRDVGSFGSGLRGLGSLGGFGRGPRLGGPRLGGVGLIILIAFFVITNLMGIDPTTILTGDGSHSATSEGDVVGDVLSGRQSESEKGNVPGAGDATSEAELKDFVAVILASTEDVWGQIFLEGSDKYQQPTLVLFSGVTQSDCGYAQAAMGPFYCPTDESIYIDLDFYRDLQTRFGARGDFAQAYVIAHEVGHHIQNLLKIMDKVHAARENINESEANALSVRVELQADCFAGIWAHQLEASDQEVRLEPGDIEEALAAASAIGDDRLQKNATGRIVPDSFTHGNSAQRVRWFQRGLDTGDLGACDTFNADKL